MKLHNDLGTGGKYLIFSLKSEEYGIDVLKIREIIGLMPMTVVPRTSKFVKGVINLRGKVVPVIDLRMKFGMPFIEYNDRTCIIVVEITDETKISLFGIMVDSVSEVLLIKSENIEAAPMYNSAGLKSEYISGMAKTTSGIKILLNTDRILKVEEMTLSHKTK